jgi:hypothetical protein
MKVMYTDINEDNDDDVGTRFSALLHNFHRRTIFKQAVAV